MMLQALIAYAEREGLGDPDFEPIGVRRMISVTLDGQLAAVIPVAQDPEAKKAKSKRRVRPKSDPDFVSHGRSYFLCDSLERCLLFVEDADKLAKRRVNQAYFVSLLEEAAISCSHEAGRLRALATFLAREEQLILAHAQLRAQKADAGENAAFLVDGVDLLNSDELKSWWRAKTATQRAQADAPMGMCLVTSAVGPLCRTTGFIKLLGEDTKLISFNKECPAFESLGLSQAANAPVSVDAEVKFRDALNRLIDLSRGDGLVWNNTVHLHWTREPVPVDPIDALSHADPQAVERLLKSVRGGQEESKFAANAYYAMSLSGNGARIMVRDWLELTVGEVAEHVAEWFDDLSIVDQDGVTPRRDFKFGALLYGMVREKRPGEKSDPLDNLPPQIPTQLFHAALRGTSLPQPALAAAVRRQQLEVRKPADKFDPRLKPARMALIKACLLRSPNRKPTDSMTPTLDPESKDRAYLCGQLFAVIGRVQLLALGKIGASLADRTYGGVATRPATTLGPVFTKLPAYIKKANVRLPGSGTNRQKEIENLCQRIEAQGGIQKILGLEEQGRFALGYYCQLARYRADKAEAAAAEKAEELPDENI